MMNINMETNNPNTHNNSNNNNNQINLPAFILSVNNGMARVTSKIANAVLYNKMNLYRMIKDLGWYIPEPESKAVTSEYLLAIQRGTIFRIESGRIIPYREEVIKRKKIDLYIYLKQEFLENQDLGYDSTKLPSRKYLLNIIHTLNSKYEVFTGVQTDEKIVEIPLQ